MSGGDNGVSVAVVEHEERMNPDTGKLVITDRHHDRVTVREIEPRTVKADLEKLGLVPDAEDP